MSLEAKTPEQDISEKLFERRIANLEEGARRERERLMLLLDKETISHLDRGQRAVRQWARAWINEQDGAV